ncbi:putative bifunctional UDP-N-acetylglucosamine transferase and deubiquitinase ALG13 [Ahaetulla prasina]|uniref:putative bifunctional UDP-N-acetylglucosamine transferase and deubiquitinase ALG13 n=1 Tax=Ahaetulla prasina TaxID=499056 RepID=UPI002649398F|nr:putative bifunctional UDP-N-acetylglucosamine transferase and deubiquitinase ALG13 [Ahaetulla prasina]
MKSVFVTVGTTSFDDLIAAVTTPEATQVLQDLGCRKLVIQVGRGKECPDSFSTATFTLEVFRFKSSLSEDIKKADLVISHAGAGSCLEVLEAGKPLLVAINDKLMDNHQLELARQLHKDGHLFYCTSRTLVEMLKSMDLSTLKPFLPGQPEKFAAFLDSVVGSQGYAELPSPSKTPPPPDWTSAIPKRLVEKQSAGCRHVPVSHVSRAAARLAWARLPTAETLYGSLLPPSARLERAWPGHTFLPGSVRLDHCALLPRSLCPLGCPAPFPGVVLPAASPACFFPALAMQKGWKKYFGQKSLSEVTMDEYLGSQGLYRKLTAKDATCLFRAISEQVYACQIHHMAVRNACVSFMRKNQINFESYVEGSFEKYLQRLGNPKESAGQLEISAFSLIYNRDFILYRHPGKPASYATDNGFEDKILLCCSSNGHYDSVYTKQFQVNAAICQAVLYEILYKNVFKVDEEELKTALEMFRSGAKKNRNSASVGSEDANFDCLPDRASRNAPEKRLEDWVNFDSAHPAEEKCKQVTEEGKENPRMPFPYKVLKALDPEIYRNIEFDVWLESRKELQKTDYLVFAGRQYYLGDKCQVRLETGEKYYNAHIQDVGQDNMVTVFIEELAEKHVVPLVNLKPVTQVTPLPAWNVMSNRKGGSYQKIPDMDMKTRKKLFKKVHGKEVYMTVAYSRGHPVLPPRLQHSIATDRSSSVHCSPNEHINPYDHYHFQNSQRTGRGYGMSRGSARFINKNNITGPEIAFYPSPGKRCYQSYDNFSYRSRSYSRSRRQMQCVNKECQYGFSPENGEESPGVEETMTFYEIEEGDDANFPALPTRGNPTPIVPAPAGFWVTRSTSNSIPPNKPGLNNSEEVVEEPTDTGEYHEDYLYTPPDPECETTTIFNAAESTTNLDAGANCVSSQEAATSYSYSQKVMVNSAIISSSSCVNTAPAAIFSSSCSASTQVTITASTPQNAVPPILVTSSVGRPVVSVYQSSPLPPVSDVGENGNITPPYSCDPSGSDLPRDPKVLQYYFNLGLQYYHQTCWNPVMYVQQPPSPPPHVETYQTYSEQVSVVDSSAPLPYNDVGRNDLRQMPADSSSTDALATPESSSPPSGTIYYPVVTDTHTPSPVPGYESCVSFVPAYHCVGSWYPVNASYRNSARIHNNVNPSHFHQVSYVTSSNPQPHFVAQSM